MEATERVEQTMRKIERKIKDDFKRMTLQIIDKQKEIEEMSGLMDNYKSKYESSHISFLEVKKQLD